MIAYDFYTNQNNHTQTLTIDRTLVAPTQYRYYLQARPICIALYLGHFGSTMHPNFAVSSTCTAQFASNTVDVTVIASDDAIIDTYSVSVMVYVLFEGQYFGYF